MQTWKYVSEGRSEIRPVYTPAQFHAEIANEMSLTGVYLAIRHGDIPSKRIGKRIFIPGAYVESLQTM